MGVCGATTLPLLSGANYSFVIMYPLEEMTESTCCGYRDQHPHNILYNILSGGKSRNLDAHRTTALSCHCEQRTVCLKDPKATCQVASDVLVKTMRFIRSLPSFRQLPQGDQSILLKHCWVPLFVLGLAQEKIVFEVTDGPNPSLLRKILLGPGQAEKEAERPTLSEVHKLRTCLHQLWNLDLSPKEYAYLKGALLFNPGKMMSNVKVFMICDVNINKHCSICYSCLGIECLGIHRRPPTGSSPCSPRDHLPPARSRLRSL